MISCNSAYCRVKVSSFGIGSCSSFLTSARASEQKERGNKLRMFQTKVLRPTFEVVASFGLVSE